MPIYAECRVDPAKLSNLFISVPFEVNRGELDCEIGLVCSLLTIL